MIKLMAILIGLFIFSHPVFPADETNKIPRAEASEVPAEAGARRRDPFWPIGFLPSSIPGGTLESAKPLESAGDKNQAANLSGMLRIGGVIKKGDKFYATINGFTVQTGEVVTAVADSEVYKFVVEGIDFNKVRFRPVK